MEPKSDIKVRKNTKGESDMKANIAEIEEHKLFKMWVACCQQLYGRKRREKISI